MQYVLGLGSNLGSRHGHFDAGLALLRAEPDCQVLRVSPRYESEPHGPPQPRYLNAAARVASTLAPDALLRRLHAIENSLGRTRSAASRWGPRTLDLDILWAERATRGEAVVPHPRLPERWFALRPLLAVAPELEPQYGPALRALPGEPLRVQSPPRAELSPTATDLRIDCHAPDLADALAASITAFGRTRCVQANTTRPAHALGGPCARGQEAAACWHAVLAYCALGQALSHATLAELGPGRFTLLVLPADPQPAAANALSLTHVEVARTGTGLHLRTRLRTDAGYR